MQTICTVPTHPEGRVEASVKIVLELYFDKRIEICSGTFTITRQESVHREVAFEVEFAFAGTTTIQHARGTMLVSFQEAELLWRVHCREDAMLLNGHDICQFRNTDWYGETPRFAVKDYRGIEIYGTCLEDRTMC